MSQNTTTNGGTPNPWEAKELGVFWKRTKQGTTESYLTGNLNLKNLIAQGVDLSQDIQVIMFTNKKKLKETHPDLRLYISEKRDATAKAPAKTTAPVKATAKPATAAPKTAATAVPDNELI